MEEHLIIVRGGGDLATGTIHRLWSAGFPVLVWRRNVRQLSGGRYLFPRRFMTVRPSWKR